MVSPLEIIFIFDYKKAINNEYGPGIIDILRLCSICNLSRVCNRDARARDIEWGGQDISRDVYRILLLGWDHFCLRDTWILKVSI